MVPLEFIQHALWTPPRAESNRPPTCCVATESVTIRRMFVANVQPVQSCRVYQAGQVGETDMLSPRELARCFPACPGGEPCRTKSGRRLVGLVEKPARLDQPPHPGRQCCHACSCRFRHARRSLNTCTMKCFRRKWRGLEAVQCNCK